MYKISVPVMNANVKRNGREKTLSQLKRLDASRVFLSLDCYETNLDKRKEVLCELADNCRYFKSRGFEVGAWIWTFMIKGDAPFRRMCLLSGKEIAQNMCPTDERFLAFASEYIADIAKCGVDLIMFDDDFRYGFLGDTAGCLCEGHVAEINRILGEPLTREKIAPHITSGGKNKYRDAFLKANGDAFCHFARTVRAAVDAVNPKIRMGACSCMTSWDVDGVDARTLAQALAGNTKPFVRLIGAPYWAPRMLWGNALQDVIELERMESAWTKTEDIEVFAEGDVNPRPRFKCPASYLEGFDTALRAAGCTDGILKYGIDYVSNADYEDGYVIRHERNRAIYAAINRIFGDKKSTGVRIYESMHKVANMVIPTAVNDTVDVQAIFFSKAARALAHTAIPTVYEGEGAFGIVFDENARDLPLSALSNGLVLDIAAAEILDARGVDVGIDHIGKATEGQCEHFLSNDNHILANGIPVYELALKTGAEVLSDMETPLGTVPVSFRYENANGNRFLIWNYNTRVDDEEAHWRGKPLKHYARARQLAENASWLSGKLLPAFVYGNPALYLQCKEGDGTLAVGLWNFFADEAISPVVELAECYASVECVGATATLNGDRVTLSNIPPFGYSFLLLKK